MLLPSYHVDSALRDAAEHIHLDWLLRKWIVIKPERVRIALTIEEHGRDVRIATTTIASLHVEYAVGCDSLPQRVVGRTYPYLVPI